MFNKRKRYVAIFLIKEQNSYTIIDKKFFNPIKDSIEYRSNTYIINTSTPTYTKGLKLLFFIDTDTKKQLLFVKRKDTNIDTEIVDLIMSKKIIKQLTSELGGIDFKTILLYLGLGLLIGGLIGYLLGGGSIG